MCMFHSVLGLRQPRIVRAWNFTGGVRLGLTPCHSSVGFAPALSGSHMNPAYSCRSLSALLLAALVAGCISGEPAQKPPGESSNVGGNGSGSTGTAPGNCWRRSREQRGRPECWRHTDNRRCPGGAHRWAVRDGYSALQHWRHIGLKHRWTGKLWYRGGRTKRDARL